VIVRISFEGGEEVIKELEELRVPFREFLHIALVSR
jgi:hypothetical protein